MSSPIREADEPDGATIVDLWTAAYVNEGVVERGAAVVGVVALAAPGAPEPAVARADEAELARLVVAASARRLGIGRALVGHCAEIARAAGWGAIALWSRPYQVAAHRLYESLGYRRAPERDRVDESGHGRLVFRLEL
jgi:ribosomal protein S18 acetylase RimI-like enzyme